MERKLAAIISADVVGYSALMERDEVGTFHRVKNLQTDVLEPEVAKRRGHIFKAMGDGFLAEFGSVVDAVECAVSIQSRLIESNQSAPDEHRIEVRIGVNFGDVLIDRDDRFGEGVNLAARLQQAAEPGGIWMSAQVAREAQSKVSVSFEPMGHQLLKNLEPVLAYRVAHGHHIPNVLGGALPIPGKPSLAVLPFVNMSVDPEQEYFADGLVEDLITGLSKVPSLFVIARNSTFAFKGKAIDVRSIARELGVRYIVEGSVRRGADRLRITAQLIEAADGTHLWADKYDGAVTDIFDLQDLLTESIVGAIEPSVRRAEIERARRKRPERLDAYDIYMRALPHIHANKPADNDEALKLLNRALQLDPNFALANAYAAWGHEQRYFRDGHRSDDKVAAEKHARLALSAGVDDPQALSIAAFALARVTGDHAGGVRTLEHALQLNGNSSLAYSFSALLNASLERYDRAIEHANRALRLSPLDPLNYHAYCALAHCHFLNGRHDETVRSANAALRVNPEFWIAHAFLLAGLAELKKYDEMNAVMVRLLELAPDLTVERFARMEFVRPNLMAGIAAALRRAGLPEDGRR